MKTGKHWTLGSRALAALIAVWCFFSCGEDNQKPKLTGTVNIKGTVQVGEEVEAEVVGGNGTDGKFAYQWTADSLEITGADGKKYTIPESVVDQMLDVIVSNTDTIGTISNGGKKVEPNPNTVPHDQTPAPLTNLFGEGYSASVTGNMSNVDWNGVPGKVEGTLNSAFGSSGNATKNTFRSGFMDNDVEIVVEKNPSYNKYNVEDGKTQKIYLNRDWLMTASDEELKQEITKAVSAMANWTADMVKSATRDAGGAMMAATGISLVAQ